jgi:hypothetical protein
MQSMKVLVVIWTILILLSTAKQADAYIDPGSGSYILQLLIATFFGALFALKMYWKKMKSYFGGNPKENDDNSERPN